MLYIVSTPIGNPEDITLRALRILREADAIICEERREGTRLARHFQIENEIIDLNEHTERARVPELIERLQRGETLALISDHGTPLLADPGSRFVQRAIEMQLAVSAVPGASSLLAALVVSGLAMERFRFVGLLPVKKDERQMALRRLREDRDTWVIFDAPYRLSTLLADLELCVGGDRPMTVACNLTMPDETIVRGTIKSVADHFGKHPFKGEYVVIVAGQQRIRGTWRT
jgi:16S rRNA (cytidine1402-2'-O)-methyltransferase